MKQTRKKNEKGFTMIELIIVVAIMGIIGAVLVPMFGTMAAKARVTTDITTVKTIQRQLDIYKADKGSYPTGFDITTADGTGTKVPDSSVITKLVTDEYLDSKDLNVTGTGTAAVYSLKLQTQGEIWVDNSRCFLQVSNKDYKKIVENINDPASKDGNKGWIKGIGAAAPAAPTTP